jgi:hypothetical protein
MRGPEKWIWISKREIHLNNDSSNKSHCHPPEAARTMASSFQTPFLLFLLVILLSWNGIIAWSPNARQHSRPFGHPRIPQSSSSPITAGDAHVVVVVVVASTHKQHRRRMILRGAMDESIITDVSSISPFAIAGLALLLGIAAQTFINQMLEGDDGLGAFLKDGSGYNKSGYRPLSKGTTNEGKKNADPLPWLKLPQLDFVEVAGQRNRNAEELVYQQFEQLRQEMNEKIEEGKLEQASAIREELEALMKEAGIEYKSDQ